MQSYSTSNNDELKVITKKQLENKIRNAPNEFYLIDVRGTLLTTIPSISIVFIKYWFLIKSRTRPRKEQYPQRN